MDILKFYNKAIKLKDVKRTGWVERGVSSPESVADHSFMMALMCMVMPERGIDKEKAIKMALIHDIAEAETGDIITKENWEEKGTMTRAEKSQLEENVLKKMLSHLDVSIAQEIISLWREYNEGKIPEAVFVNDIDNAERIIQAYGYHSKGNFEKPLNGFWDEKCMSHIRNERIKKLVKNIIGKGQ